MYIAITEDIEQLTLLLITFCTLPRKNSTLTICFVHFDHSVAYHQINTKHNYCMILFLPFTSCYFILSQLHYSVYTSINSERCRLPLSKVSIVNSSLQAKQLYFIVTGGSSCKLNTEYFFQ